MSTQTYTDNGTNSGVTSVMHVTTSPRYSPADALKEVADKSRKQLDANLKRIEKLREQKATLQTEINTLVTENEALEQAARRADPAPRKKAEKKAEK